MGSDGNVLTLASAYGLVASRGAAFADKRVLSELSRAKRGKRGLLYCVWTRVAGRSIVHTVLACDSCVAHWGRPPSGRKQRKRRGGDVGTKRFSEPYVEQ